MLLLLVSCAALTPAQTAAVEGVDSAESAQTADTAELDITAAIYAPYGNCRQVETYWYHGTASYISTSWADAAGRDIAEENDNDADGTPDDSWKATRDADELLLTWAGDTDADGNTDNRTTYTNEDGHAVRVEFDDDVDGQIDWVYLYTYSVEGYVERAETWSGEVLYSAWTYTWTTDVPNLLRLGDYDEGANGSIDAIRDVTYDQYPFQRRIDSDEDADGNLEWRYDYTYDASAHVLSGAYFYWEEGELAYTGTIRYGYDEAWRITSMLYEQYQEDETDSALKEFVYDCEE